MDRVLKSYDFEVCYDATVVHKPHAPELLDGKATDRKFHALGSALESSIQNKPLMLGRLFAAAMSQQVALKTMWELAPRRPSPNSGEPLVESIMEPLTVRIDGLDLTKPATWWAETDDPRDEWIQRFNGNVADVLVPVIQACKVGSQRIKQDHGQNLCHACRLQGTHWMRDIESMGRAVLFYLYARQPGFQQLGASVKFYRSINTCSLNPVDCIFY
ncbi:hypothetical protein F5B22DRAFT_587808 [Xylaria bambusicola]|uniref:uncharacterized protein n=1 Tax=Xylaria bambusicola TaxID=326684 RepID=UPI00200868AA|nr:uncharacterized protein F5B22DRAFT_587808 [Xylaria bambusicola]KAI0525800.1 hypothetical protein F5B22DRAFT_587808 [Xylaria bambusicola]